MTLNSTLLNSIVLGAAGWVMFLSQFALGIESAVPAAMAVCLWLPAMALSVFQLISRTNVPRAVVGIVLSFPPLAVITYMLYFLLVLGGPDGAG